MTVPAATRTAKEWLSRLSSALESSPAAAADLFVEDCYWRDFLSFTWNIKTLEGRSQIADMLSTTLAATSPANWEIDGEATADGEVIQAWFRFDTNTARGYGHLRLRGDACWTILTTMTELKGHEENRGTRRIKGVEHRARKDRSTWLEDRQQEEAELGTTRQPYCLIVGGGQGGIALGARLRRLGVPTIIIEKNDRPGDSWRNRYRSLVLHDPVWYDHLPYLPFPDDWPVFTPKDKMGDWLECYTKVMELNYWPSTECLGAAFDADQKRWTVEVNRNGKTIELKPQQLVFATGAYGFPNVIEFPGADSFEGETFHTSAYQSGESYRGKKCAVIGSGSSAHDICVDLWENNAEVTMIQRSPSIVVRSESLMEIAFAPLYSEKAVTSGISTEKADLLSASVPYGLVPEFQTPIYEEIARIDAEFYDRLSKAGFLWDFGEDGSGLMAKAMRTASGYYIDVGASGLIADGEIRVKSGAGIESIGKDAIHLDNGSSVPADVIVHATGYGSLDGMVARLISPETAEKIGKFWGYGSGIAGDPGPWEGELRNMWKPTNQEALWFHGGNLHLSRHFSLYVALQIKARMENIPTPVYPSS